MEFRPLLLTRVMRATWPRVWMIPLLAVLLSACAQRNLSSSGESEASVPDAESLYQQALVRLGAPEAEQDYATANRLFEQAAEQGHRKAQYFLGMAYHVGRGVRQSYPRARYWLEQAAYQGDANAQHHLGDIYLNGWGVAPDPAWAAMWYGRSAQQGLAAAQFSLGVCYSSGLGVPKQPLRARGWLGLAARQNYPQALALERKLAGQSGGAPARVFLGKDGWESPPVITYVQVTLAHLGYDPGPVDGVWGARSASALARFLGLPGDEGEIVLAPEILDVLRRANGTLPSPFIDTLRRWFS